jgi:hypothetical protein
MTERRMFLYRGALVVEGWPEQMLAAQEIKTRRLGDRVVPRVRYGEESGDWGASTRPCGDCAVIKGEFHVEGCDIERCANCGGQRISCACEDADED